MARHCRVTIYWLIRSTARCVYRHFAFVLHGFRRCFPCILELQHFGMLCTGSHGHIVPTRQRRFPFRAGILFLEIAQLFTGLDFRRDNPDRQQQIGKDTLLAGCNHQGDIVGSATVIESKPANRCQAAAVGRVRQNFLEPVPDSGT